MLKCFVVTRFIIPHACVCRPSWWVYIPWCCWLTTRFTKGTKMLQQKCSATWVAHMTLANAAEAAAAAAAEIHELWRKSAVPCIVFANCNIEWCELHYRYGNKTESENWEPSVYNPCWCARCRSQLHIHALITCLIMSINSVCWHKIPIIVKCTEPKVSIHEDVSIVWVCACVRVWECALLYAFTHANSSARPCPI